MFKKYFDTKCLIVFFLALVFCPIICHRSQVRDSLRRRVRRVRDRVRHKYDELKEKVQEKREEPSYIKLADKIAFTLR